MRPTPKTRQHLRAAALAFASLGLCAHGVRAEGTYRVSAADVQVTCPMTVGGSFQATTSALSGELGFAAAEGGLLTGSLIVDLTSLDTGIGLRNTHLKENYLEVERGAEYAAAELSGIELKGLVPAAPEGKGSFSGSFRLHGEAQAVSGSVEVSREGEDLKVTATFPVSVKAHQIKKPSYLGVGVKDEVKVKVELRLAVVPAAAGTH